MSKAKELTEKFDSNNVSLDEKSDKVKRIESDLKDLLSMVSKDQKDNAKKVINGIKTSLKQMK